MVMNAKDAQGLMEDLAIIDATHQGAMDSMRAANTHAEIDHERTMTSIAVATVALKERNDRISELRQDRNHNVIHATALQRTLDHVLRDFARAAGVPEDKLRERYNIVRTQHFNALSDEGMQRGCFDKDPRLQMKKAREWYVPGLDADHGF